VKQEVTTALREIRSKKATNLFFIKNGLIENSLFCWIFCEYKTKKPEMQSAGRFYHFFPKVRFSYENEAAYGL